MKRIQIIILILASMAPVILNAQVGHDNNGNPVAEEPDEINQGEPLFFYQVQEKAEFIFGEDSLRSFISTNLVIPDSVVKGMMIVEFIVEKDSSITAIQISPRTSMKYTPEMAANGIEVLRKTSGMWKPAKQRDKVVRMRFAMPIRFVQ